MAMLQVLEDCNLWKDFPKGLHVLVVDRDTEALNDIKTKLEECKYEVTAFERSEDAVSALGNPSNSFHVALVEAAIGEGLDGFSILSAKKHNNIPTIMMSDKENRDVMLQAFALGAVEFLQKPLSDEKLKNVWQHAVRKAISLGGKSLPQSLKSAETTIESPINSPSASASDQIASEEEILCEEKEDLVLEPNRRGHEKIVLPSTPQQQHINILNPREENGDESSGSETLFQNIEIQGDETQAIQVVEMTNSAEYSGSTNSSCLDEVKKELEGFSSEIQISTDCENGDLNYFGKMEMDSTFDDFCLGDGELNLSDLEIDPGMLADFSLEDHGELDLMNLYSLDHCGVLETDLAEEEALLLAEVSKAEKEQLMKNIHDSTISTHSADTNVKEEVLSDDKKSNRSESVKIASKNELGKRKVKVDWTPELHRRFVQAVEQLGIDKAVPSRILELMGVNCLTRHNIASHLQKYRSHRKHLLAREAEAASWNHRRQIYASTGTRNRREVSPWSANNSGGHTVIQPRPPMGYPPHPHPHPPFRPFHVWGHPTRDHSLLHMWHKQPLAAAPPGPWAAADGTFWQHHPSPPTACTDTWGHNAPAQGTPCYPQPLVRLPVAPAPGVPHFNPPVFNGDHYRPEYSSAVHTDIPAHLKPAALHPSKETVDAAINEVLTNPWTPLPIGLKPPSLESVMTELQRQGISNVPLVWACLAR